MFGPVTEMMLQILDEEGEGRAESEITCCHWSFSVHFTVMPGRLISRLDMLTVQCFNNN